MNSCCSGRIGCRSRGFWSHLALPAANFRTLHSFRLEIGTDGIFESVDPRLCMAQIASKQRISLLAVNSDTTETACLSSMKDS